MVQPFVYARLPPILPETAAICRSESNQVKCMITTITTIIISAINTITSIVTI